MWDARSPTEKEAGVCLWGLRRQAKVWHDGEGTEEGGLAGWFIKTIGWSQGPRFGPAPRSTTVGSSPAAGGGEARASYLLWL